MISRTVIAVIAWPTSSWLRAYLDNRGLVPVKGCVVFKHPASMLSASKNLAGPGGDCRLNLSTRPCQG
jgi:hypothetical protein